MAKSPAEKLVPTVPEKNPGVLNPEPITCVARSVICIENQGYRNFKILTLHIVDGVVTKIERSDSWLSWETISRMELANLSGILSLSDSWLDGKTMFK